MTRTIETVVAIIGVALCFAPSAGATFAAGGGELLYTWTDGSQKAASTTTGVDALRLRTRVRRNVFLCSWNARPGENCFNYEGAASADGRRAAIVVADRVGDSSNMAYRLAIVGLDDGGTSSVPLSGPASDPAWSPAGDQLLVTYYEGSNDGRKDGVPRVAVLAADGRDLGAVSPPGGSDGDWSSNGEIAFTLGGDIWVTRLGETPRRLTTKGGLAPTWSPNGESIAFERDDRLWTIRRDGSDERRLTRIQAHAPAWSPDGRYLAFMGSGTAGPGYTDVWVMPSDGRCPRRVVRAAFYRWYQYAFWRPVADADQPEPCAHLRPDMRPAKRVVRVQGTGFPYRFRAVPRIQGWATFLIPGRSRVAAHAFFTAGPRGAVRIQPQLSRPARQALRAKGSLRLTVGVTVVDYLGLKPTPGTAGSRLKILARGSGR